MARLSIFLLGPFRVILDGELVTGFVSDKARALLAYLATEANHPHRRETLAGLLWSDYPEQDARRSLSNALANVRRVIGDREANPAFLEITHQTVQFNRASDSWIDVAAFIACLKTSQDPRQAEPGTISQLKQAAELYQAEFLKGFSVADSDLFEQWALRERGYLEGLALKALQDLSQRYESRGQIADALQYATQQVDLAPWQENAHRQLMRLLMLDGQRAAALKQYEVCRHGLIADLGVEPSEKTRQLYEQIRAGVLQSSTNPSRSPLPAPQLRMVNASVRPDVRHPPSGSGFLSDSASPFIVGPPITEPHHFFGREGQLKRLFDLWKRTPLQNAAIIGPRRSGKTSLLLYLKSITTASQEQLRPGQRTDWLADPNRYHWIYLDFQDPRLRRREGLLRQLLTHLSLPVPEPCDLDRFMDVVSDGLRMPTVILLDEIGAALRRCPDLDDTFWEGLRALAANLVDGHLAFVLAAHESPIQLAHHCGHSSPFFNIFGYTALLGPLTEAEARKLIATSPICFMEEDIEWILARSKCWPILLQILCRECFFALQEDDSDSAWRRDALRQMESFRYLLEGNL